MKARSIKNKSLKAFAALFILVLAVGSGCSASNLSSMTIEWTRQFGGAGNQSANSLAFGGGVITVGYSTPDNQQQVAVISKQDLDGNESWSKQVESSGDSDATSVCGSENSIFVCGFTSGTISNQTSAGGTDAFVCMFDLNGSLKWIRQFGSDQNDVADSISFFDNKIYIAETSYSGSPEGSGTRDASLICFDAAGNQLWTRHVDTLQNDECASVYASETGIYLTGASYGAVSSGSSDVSPRVFVCKYDFNGNQVWLKQISSGKGDRGQSIVVMGNETYVFGTTYGSMGAQLNLGDSDAFIIKLDKNGNELWTKQFGTSASDFAGGVSVHAGNIYITGNTTGVFPGQRNSGGSDVFVGSYSTDGKQLNLIEFGTGSDDYSNGIQVSALGIYVCGLTKGSFQDSSTSGGSGAFVAKLHDRC